MEILSVIHGFVTFTNYVFVVIGAAFSISCCLGYLKGDRSNGEPIWRALFFIAVAYAGLHSLEIDRLEDRIEVLENQKETD